MLAELGGGSEIAVLTGWLTERRTGYTYAIIAGTEGIDRAKSVAPIDATAKGAPGGEADRCRRRGRRGADDRFARAERAGARLRRDGATGARGDRAAGLRAEPDRRRSVVAADPHGG